MKIVELQSREEASAFVKFLHNEVLRHYEDIRRAEADIAWVENRWGVLRPETSEVIFTVGRPVKL